MFAKVAFFLLINIILYVKIFERQSRKNAINIDTLQIFEVNIFYSGLMDTKLRKWASGFE